MLVAGFTRFDFNKVDAGKVIVKEGDASLQFIFLIRGQLSIDTRAIDGSYLVTETLSDPWLLQPEALFGLRPRYTQTVRAATEVQIITLSKNEVFRLLDRFEVIRINLFNLFSTTVQRKWGAAWKPAPVDVRGRIVRFLVQHMVYPAGPKTVKIVMPQLSLCLNEGMTKLSAELHKMSREGLVELHRGSISIPFMERLLM